MVNKTKDIVSGVGDTLSDGVQNVQDNVSEGRQDRGTTGRKGTMMTMTMTRKTPNP